MSAIAANRFGLGARPGELAAIGADGRDWLRAQLHPAPPALADAALQPSQQILAQALELQQELQAARKAGRAADDAATQQKLPQFLRPIYVSEVTARLHQAVSTERPLLERLTQFWTNHFAVSIDKQFLAGLAGSFEREAIRPHVLGNFSALLLAVETHPAMLLYLDNHLSVGPHSEVALGRGRRAPPRKIGINENLAREILELHTLGVGGGYTQRDVTTFAEVITGWSIGGAEGGFASPRVCRADSCFVPKCTSPAPNACWSGATATTVTGRALPCCAISPCIHPPRASSPASWRAISSPMSRRARQLPVWHRRSL